MRALLEEAAAEADPHELIALLDTSDARAALDLKDAGAMQGGVNKDRDFKGGNNDR